MEYLKKLQTPRGLLYAIAICIAVTHIIYIWQAHDTELFGTSVLLWAAIGTLLWERRDRLQLDSDAISTGIGCCLMVLVILRSFSLAGYHMLLSPTMAFLGLCLLATRARNLGFYWRELIILSLLAFGPIFRIGLEAINLPELTAIFSSFVLWYTGLDVVRDGTFIILPQGRVEVYGACSGIGSVTQMFNIAILFNLLIPTTWFQRGLSVAFAVLTGFVVNAGRVGLMAVLVAMGNRESFDFWHDGDGSMIFFVASVLIFSGFCWLFILREPPEDTLEAIGAGEDTPEIADLTEDEV